MEQTSFTSPARILLCVVLAATTVVMARTARAQVATADQLTFVVVGDWQIADDHVTQLAERLMAENPDLILIPGDLVMAEGGDPAPWDAFFDRIQPRIDAGVPLWPIPVNGASSARPAS